MQSGEQVSLCSQRGEVYGKINRATSTDNHRWHRCFLQHYQTQKHVSKVNLILFCFVLTAPVGKVNIQREENNITCSSVGIYPKPQLTWSTSPPSNEAFTNPTEVRKTEQLLYNISNSMTLTNTHLNYTCIITSGRHKGRATLFQTSKHSLWTLLHQGSLT